MKIDELVFIRDKSDLEIVLKKIKNKKKTIFFCLTFEAFYEAKINKLNYTYAFKLKSINKIDFLEKGKKESHLFIKKFKNRISKNDLDYLTSRFIIFFSQLKFDETVILNSINFYRPKKVWIFEEKPKSIIYNGWSQNRSFYYYKILINKLYNNQVVNTYYNQETQTKNLFRKLKKIKDNISFSNLLNSLKLILIKEPVLIEGFKEKQNLRKLFLNNFKSNKFKVITNFKNSFYVRYKYLLVKKNKNKFAFKNFQNIKIMKLNYLDLNIEIDSMIKFLINYFNFQEFLKIFLQKKKFKFGIFQQKYESIIAFRKAGIRTYQLPHGAIITPELSPMIGKYNFFPNLLQKNYHKKSLKFKGNFFLGGVPHINKSSNLNLKKQNKNIVIFMKNMGMRRWEYDDYDKVLEIINFIIKFSKKEKLNVIIKFHPSGGKFQFKYFQNAKIFNHENVTSLLDFDTNKLINENDIFVCLQESSIINQIITINKEVIFPLFHLNNNYINNYLFSEIKKNLITPKNLNQIEKAIIKIKYNLETKSKNIKIFKTKFGEDSIEMISKYIFSKQI